MTPTEQAVLKTLIYANLFDFALTSHEIYERLISSRSIQLQTVNHLLQDLVSRRLVDTNGSFYFLPGRNQLTLIRKTRLKASTAKYLQVQTLARKLSQFPLIEAIFLTGTVAVNNADSDDDIDILLITRAHSLWTTRVLVTLYLDLLGLRRKPHQTDIKNSICTNLYIDASNLRVPKQLQNLYTAHELIFATPIFDRHHFAARFLHANVWLKKYLPNAAIPKFAPPLVKLTPIPSWLEQICYNLQKLYMSPKITRETITADAAYFHPVDTATLILNKYHQALAHYGLN